MSEHLIALSRMFSRNRNVHVQCMAMDFCLIKLSH